MDNLNTHTPGSLYEAFEPAEAKCLANKLEIHYTPKHASWLNMAETELSVLSSQCLARRIPDRATLVREVGAWMHDRNVDQSTIDCASPPPIPASNSNGSTRRSCHDRPLVPTTSTFRPGLREQYIPIELVHAKIRTLSPLLAMQCSTHRRNWADGAHNSKTDSWSSGARPNASVNTPPSIPRSSLVFDTSERLVWPGVAAAQSSMLSPT